MPYTMEDFQREYAMKHFKDLTPEERLEAQKHLTPEQVLAGLSPEQVEKLREMLNAKRQPEQPKKRRRK